MQWAVRIAARWIYQNLLWDPSVHTDSAVPRMIWGVRKLALGVLVAAILTWREWIEHHPPEIALIAGIHFLLVMSVLAVLIGSIRLFQRTRKKNSTV
jgi:hypothetical protein